MEHSSCNYCFWGTRNCLKPIFGAAANKMKDFRLAGLPRRSVSGKIANEGQKEQIRRNIYRIRNHRAGIIRVATILFIGVASKRNRDSHSDWNKRLVELCGGDDLSSCTAFYWIGKCGLPLR